MNRVADAAVAIRKLAHVELIAGHRNGNLAALLNSRPRATVIAAFVRFARVVCRPAHGGSAGGKLIRAAYLAAIGLTVALRVAL